MEEKKEGSIQLCPFKAGASEDYPGSYDCDNERCALWDFYNTRCAILSIAFQLNLSR